MVVCQEITVKLIYNRLCATLWHCSKVFTVYSIDCSGISELLMHLLW